MRRLCRLSRHLSSAAVLPACGALDKRAMPRTRMQHRQDKSCASTVPGACPIKCATYQSATEMCAVTSVDRLVICDTAVPVVIRSRCSMICRCHIMIRLEWMFWFTRMTGGLAAGSARGGWHGTSNVFSILRDTCRVGWELWCVASD